MTNKFLATELLNTGIFIAHPKGSSETVNPLPRKWSMSLGREYLPPFLFVLGLTLLAISTTAYAQNYTDEQIVSAIYMAEGGKNATYPYGIRSIKCTTASDCKRICHNTVKNNRRRFAEYGWRDHDDFIMFLASRYAPIKAGNDPKGLNKNWESNVRYFLRKGGSK